MIKTFHFLCLSCILKIRWQKNITNKELLRRTDLNTTLTELRFSMFESYTVRRVDLLYVRPEEHTYRLLLTGKQFQMVFTPRPDAV